MNFKKWVKSIQTMGYNGALTVVGFLEVGHPASVVNKDNCVNHMENFCLFPLKIGPHIK